MSLSININDTKSGQFMIIIGAANGKVLMWSEEYRSKQTAVNSAKVLQEKAWCAPVYDKTEGEKPSGYRFEIDKTTHDQFMTRFTAANSEIMVWSESYTEKRGAKHCAGLVRDGIQSAVFYDNTSSAAA